MLRLLCNRMPPEWQMDRDRLFKSKIRYATVPRSRNVARIFSIDDSQWRATEHSAGRLKIKKDNKNLFAISRFSFAISYASKFLHCFIFAFEYFSCDQRRLFVHQQRTRECIMFSLSDPTLEMQSARNFTADSTNEERHCYECAVMPGKLLRSNFLPAARKLIFEFCLRSLSRRLRVVTYCGYLEFICEYPSRKRTYFATRLGRSLLEGGIKMSKTRPIPFSAPGTMHASELILT